MKDENLILLTFELLDVFYPKPQFDGDHYPVILLCQLNPDPGVLLEERVVQQDLDSISARGGTHTQETISLF